MKTNFIIIFLLVLCLQNTKIFAQSNTPDTLKPVLNKALQDNKRQKDPTTAVLLSIIPGGGQIYNEQYWKAPIFMAGVGYFVYSAVTNNSLMNEYEANKIQRDFYRNKRDANILIGLGVLGLGMIDAYSGSQLFSFDVDDKLTDNLRLRINLTHKF